MHFQNIHTCTCQKTLLHTLFYLFLRSSKDFSVSLKRINFVAKSLLPWRFGVSQKYFSCKEKCGTVTKLQLVTKI